MEDSKEFKHLASYLSDGNKVIQMKLVKSEKDLEDDETSFNPEMTHQLFGEKEHVFGFKSPVIKLYYSAGKLTTYLNFSHGQKVEDDPVSTMGVKSENPAQEIVKVIPPGYLTNLDKFRQSLAEEEAQFSPPGRVIHKYSQEDSVTGERRYFEVYSGDIHTPGLLGFHRRLQTFLLFFVDAASYIDTDDEKWHFYFTFEKFKSGGGEWRYAIASYMTVYRYFAYPSNVRPRISQVLTLPPYQGRRHATTLLAAVLADLCPNPRVTDITVEDPSIEFQRVRDLVDCRRCFPLPEFSKENLMQGFSRAMRRKAYRSLRINKLQARRVYEILRLHHTNVHDEAELRAYRLDVKRRLNVPFQKQKNDDAKLKRVLPPDEYEATIAIMSQEGRIAKLDELYSEIYEDYTRVVKRLEEALAGPEDPLIESARAPPKTGSPTSNGSAQSTPSSSVSSLSGATSPVAT